MSNKITENEIELFAIELLKKLRFYRFCTFAKVNINLEKYILFSRY